MTKHEILAVLRAFEADIRWCELQESWRYAMDEMDAATNARFVEALSRIAALRQALEREND